MTKNLIFSGIIIIIFLFSCNENSQQMKKNTNNTINLTDLDTNVSPANDFYQYANGGWMKSNPLPADKGRYSTFDQLADKAEKQLKQLINEIADGDNNDIIAKKIGLFYNMGMDSAKIEKNGLHPLKEYFERIDNITNINDVLNVTAYLHTHNIHPLFNIYADADSKNSEMVIAQLSQGGLGMPDRDYYTDNDERSENLRSKYLEHLKSNFMLMGNDDETSAYVAKTIMDIETKLAKSSMTRLERRDPFKTYNKHTVSKLQELSPKINWTEYFSNIGLSNLNYLNVNQPDFFKNLSSVLTDFSIDDWKNYLKWNLIRGTSNYLSNEFIDSHFEFYGKTMSGSLENRPRWKRVLGTTNSALSEAIGKLYVAKYFPPKAKERMKDLVANLKSAYAIRIDQLPWMSSETKQKAQEKLETINVKVGYPDKWRDYSALEVKNDAYVLNVLRSNNFEFEYMIGKIDKAVDKIEWHMPPQMVNAYYNPSMNEIVFPAAILQAPFFYMDADDAVNYGAIGVVIGHEMTHGFDDQGKNYDKNGNLNEWWTIEDNKKFKQRTKMLVDQFNSFVVLDTIHADGELTLGENIADLGGLCISYTALQMALKENPQEKINGFTAEQRFYLAYAHVWAQNIRDKEILRRTKEDVHSLGNLRVNGPLPNLIEFYNAFGIKEGDKMWLPENKRVKIW